MRHFLILIVLFFNSVLHAQVSSFNQLGSLPSTNPAFIANLGKDQLALITRNQWPGNKLGSLTNELTYNKFFERINSSFGIISNYNLNHQGLYNSLSEGIQYGYRVFFMERAYLCAGVGITHQRTELDLNNFHYLYEPKRNYLALPEKNIKNESMNTSYGIFLHDWSENQYIGFSVKDQPLTQLKNSGTGNLRTDASFSLQAMKGIPITRTTLLITLLELERSGKTTYTIQDTGTTVLQPASYYFSLQENIYLNKTFMLGFGYKYFSKNYGCFNTRLNFFSLGGLPLLLGFSFDTKPYIQYDKIKFNCSYEFYIKYNFYQAR